MKINMKKKLRRMYPFSFSEQCNPDSMLLTSKKTENLFSSDLDPVSHTLTQKSKGDAVNVHKD